MASFVSSARQDAERWAARMSALARILARIEGNETDLLGATFGFLIARAIEGLYRTIDTPPPPLVRPESIARAPGGADLRLAVEVSQSAHQRRDPLADELEVLLHLSDTSEGGRFVDPELDAGTIGDEFRRLDVLTGPGDSRLLPPAVREAWDRLCQQARDRADPVQRLSIELNLVRVVRALYATAVGLRALPDEAGRDPLETVQLAWTIGETSLRSPGMPQVQTEASLSR